MIESPPIRLLQEANLSGLSVIRDEIQYLFVDREDDSHAVTLTLKNLFHYMFSRNQTVSFLISYGYSWDAEIILRSFYEVAAKILLLCLSEENEKPILVDEFWDGLGRINERKRARKAKFVGQQFEKDSISASIFSMLQDGRIFDLQSGSKTERKRLEQKWSFSEMIAQLSKLLSNGKTLEEIISLLHTYGMASHLIHGDQTAIELIYDRETRSLEERKVLEAAHVARIMTDQISITWFCADALRQHFRAVFSDAANLRQVFDRVVQLAEPFQAAFEDSQRDFYARLQENLA
jgi:Family of unknown function (DUF5677)